MELKAGYKQTEVGRVPESWSVKELGDFAPFITSGSRGWANHYSEFGASFLRITNLSRSWVYPQLDYLKFVSLPKGDFEGARTQLKNGDLLISITADIGIIGYVDVKVPKPAYINQHIALVRLDPSAVNSLYTSYFLASANGQALFRAWTDSGAKAGMNLSTVRKILAVFPPSLDEQKAIAEALSNVDALIESLRKLLTKKRQIKQGTMQELLTGQCRLPGFSGEWVESSLLELAGGRKELFDDGDWIESEHITSDGIRLVQTGNIGVGRFLDKTEKKYIYEASFASLRCKEIREGDLLICRLAEPAGRACILPNIGEYKIVTSVDVTIFRPPKELANREFLVNLFSMPEWFQVVSEISGGTTHKRISRGALGRIRVKLPKLREQSAIACILSQIDNDITTLETKLQKARHLKQGMMQELLTGRIRLV